MSKHVTSVYGGTMLEVVKLVKGLDQSFSLKKAYINTNSIVAVESDELKTKNFREEPDSFPEGLDERTAFSTVSFNGGAVTNYITVVGSPEFITSKV
jgi:hypothetical protein